MEKAARSNIVMVIGDMKLDFVRWQNLDQVHTRMVEITKQDIETIGFVQIVKGITCTWPGQSDSLLDQCWTNRPQCIISHQNEVRSYSDHNLICVTLRTKDKIVTPQEIYKRICRNFDLYSYRAGIGAINWSPLFNTTDLNVMNTVFEEEVGKVLEAHTPLKSIQVRKNHCNWLDTEVIHTMRDGDNHRESARLTGSQADWSAYRLLRNKCTKMLRNKKNKYMSGMYNSYHSKQDISSIYRTTKEILGWAGTTQPTCFLINGTLIRKPVELANALQSHFINKIGRLISGVRKSGQDPLNFLLKAFSRWNERENLPNFTLRDITITETLTLISKMGNSTAIGRDGLDALSIKLLWIIWRHLLHR